MPKPRVYELARELGLSSQEIIEKLKAMGIEAKAPSSSVDEDQATKFKRHVRLETQSSKKGRVYGSEEDEGERDALEKEREAKVAAERAARELRGQGGREGTGRPQGGGSAQGRRLPLRAAAPAVRLAPRVAVKPVETATGRNTGRGGRGPRRPPGAARLPSVSGDEAARRQLPRPTGRLPDVRGRGWAPGAVEAERLRSHAAARAKTQDGRLAPGSESELASTARLTTTWRAAFPRSVPRPPPCA